MLRQLYIRNYTLIEKLDVEFENGFSVITGETGAGKSIILGAIALLLGQRADSKAIKKGADKCVIEAHFDLSKYGMQQFFEQNDIEYDDTDCIIRRELTASGKSRAFINDSPAPLSMLKELGEQLVDVHSQHKNLLLGKQDFQLNVVDIIAGDADEIAAYRKAFKDYKEASTRLDRLKKEIEQNRINADFLQFQFDELDNARLTDGEQEELEQKTAAMSHTEDIKTALYETDSSLSQDSTGAVDSVKAAANAISGISDIMPEAKALYERLDSCYIELKDISGEISSMLDSISFNPSELDSMNNRLDKLYDLEKKYRCESVAGLIQERESIRIKLDTIVNSDMMLKETEDEVDRLREICSQKAGSLTRLRKKASSQIEAQLLESLTSLGMPNAIFKIVLEQCPFNADGADKVSFMFCANKNGAMQPIYQVASGGEIARVMLSIKAMISSAVKLPTIIFDEIDTGVSGKIAEKMAHIMQKMGENNRQVISITHLPQIAALGKNHYKVSKEDTTEGTISRMLRLSPQERISEIAQMLSGSDVTEAAVNNARELLKQ